MFIRLFSSFILVLFSISNLNGQVFNQSFLAEPDQDIALVDIQSKGKVFMAGNYRDLVYMGPVHYVLDSLGQVLSTTKPSVSTANNIVNVIDGICLSSGNYAFTGWHRTACDYTIDEGSVLYVTDTVGAVMDSTEFSKAYTYYQITELDSGQIAVVTEDSIHIFTPDLSSSTKWERPSDKPMDISYLGRGKLALLDDSKLYYIDLQNYQEVLVQSSVNQIEKYQDSLLLTSDKQTLYTLDLNGSIISTLNVNTSYQQNIHELKHEGERIILVNDTNYIVLDKDLSFLEQRTFITGRIPWQSDPDNCISIYEDQVIRVNNSNNQNQLHYESQKIFEPRSEPFGKILLHSRIDSVVPYKVSNIDTVITQTDMYVYWSTTAVNMGSDTLKNLKLIYFPHRYGYGCGGNTTVEMSGLSVGPGDSVQYVFPPSTERYISIMGTLNIRRACRAVSANGLIIQNAPYSLGTYLFLEQDEEIEQRLPSAEVYPNPASQYLKVKLPEDKDICDFQIHGIAGNLIKQGQLVNEQLLNVDHLVPGVYILVLTRDGRKSGLKFLKK